MLKGTTSILAAGGTITPAAPLHRIHGTPGSVTISLTNAIADGDFDGQLLTLVGDHATSLVTIKDGANVELNGAPYIIFALGVTAQFRWDDDRGLWVNYGTPGIGMDRDENLSLLNAHSIRFYELTAFGENLISIGAPSSLSATYSLTLPSAQGGAGTFLKNNGAGVLSWGSTTSSLQAAYDGGEDIAVAAMTPIALTGSGTLLSVGADLLVTGNIDGVTADFSGALTGATVISDGLLTVSAGGATIAGAFDLTGDATLHAGSVKLDNAKYLTIEDSGNVARNAIGRTAGDILEIGEAGVANQISVVTGNSFISFSANAAERMRITAAGGIGIGTTSPTDGGLRLEQANDADAMVIQQTTDNQCLALRKDTGNIEPVLYILNSTTADSILDDSGAKLTSAGVWTDAPCLRENKEDIEPIEPDKEFLQRIQKLSFQRYRTGREPKDCRLRYGMFLNELAELFKFGEDGISGTELASFTLGALKGVLNRLQVVEEKLGV